MLHYIYGEDTYGARQHIAQLAADTPITWIDRTAIIDTPLVQWLDQAGGGLFGSSVLVIQDPSEFLQAQQESILSHVDEMQQRSSITILWDRVSWDKRSKLFRALKPYAKVYGALDAVMCASWLIQEAERRSINVGPQVAGLLVQYVGTDRWRLVSELERLSLMTSTVTAEHIRQYVVPKDLEVEIFPLLDALVSGNQRQAAVCLDQLWRGGQNEFYVLSMLAYQFRTVLAIRQAQAQAFSPEMVAQKTQLHPYVVKKNWQVAQRISAVTCLQALSRIMATDFAIKRGTVESRTGATMLTLTLASECARTVVRS
ncbi:MAG: hypothetical protein WD200_01215 [Candidatus Andersenbacteria bacterium]